MPGHNLTRNFMVSLIVFPSQHTYYTHLGIHMELSVSFKYLFPQWVDKLLT